VGEPTNETKRTFAHNQLKERRAPPNPLHTMLAGFLTEGVFRLGTPENLGVLPLDLCSFLMILNVPVLHKATSSL
jgi:hypothetical protein